MPMTVKGGYLRGNRKGGGVYCQFTLLHPCPASLMVSQAKQPCSLRPVLFRSLPFMSHSGFWNTGWDSHLRTVLSANTGQGDQPLAEARSPPTGRELLRSHHQGAAGRELLSFSQSSIYGRLRLSLPQLTSQSPDCLKELQGDKPGKLTPTWNMA